MAGISAPHAGRQLALEHNSLIPSHVLCSPAPCPALSFALRKLRMCLSPPQVSIVFIVPPFFTTVKTREAKNSAISQQPVTRRPESRAGPHNGTGRRDATGDNDFFPFWLRPSNQQGEYCRRIGIALVHRGNFSILQRKGKGAMCAWPWCASSASARSQSFGYLHGCGACLRICHTDHDTQHARQRRWPHEPRDLNHALHHV